MPSKRWHSNFDPQKFLSRIKIDTLVERNEAYKDHRGDFKDRNCILCAGSESPGLFLNDGLYVCHTCFEEVSKTKYPEKYEKRRRTYLIECEARRQALDSFTTSCPYRKLSSFLLVTAIISFVLIFIHVLFIVLPIFLFLLTKLFRNLHQKRLQVWNSFYPIPPEPVLRHFHDPQAELSRYDEKVLKVFNNWPGYPPFWDYLRELVAQNQGNRCQVSGCPSRVELHLHHIVSVSEGGEHIPSNLVTLCSFHHALEPKEGHERIWGQIKTRYFTMVRAHERRNSKSPGYHYVRAHVRRLELAQESELQKIIEFYGFSFPSCGSAEIKLVNAEKLHLLFLGYSGTPISVG